MMRSPNRALAAIFGAGYLLIGALGFVVTGGIAFAAPSGSLFLGFLEVNPLHNVVHLVLGLGLLIAGLSGRRISRIVNSTVGTVLLVVGIVGLFTIGSPTNILAINGWDNVLHFASAIVLLTVGLGADKNLRD